MSRARKIEGLDPEARFADMARLVVGVRAEEVFEHQAGTLDTDDIERVHGMRVATRRLRAALEFFAPCFPAKAYRRELRDVKALADALGARRDPDVQIAGLRELRFSGPDRDRRALGGLIDHLSEVQRAGNARLAEELERVAAVDLRGRLRRLAESAR